MTTAVLFTRMDLQAVVDASCNYSSILDALRLSLQIYRHILRLCAYSVDRT